MRAVADLPAKMAMVLAGLSLSRVAVAHRLGVDKSVVGRWLAGTVHPSEHNLARLSQVVAEVLPGFSLADWDDDIAAMAHRHELMLPGVHPASALPASGSLGAFLETARFELEANAAPYEGLWRTSRPSLLMNDEIFHDYGLIHRRDDGLVEVRMGGSGLDFSGYLFPVAGNVFVSLFDPVGRSPLTVLCRGVALPRAMVLDGLLLLAALDSDRTPVAMPIVVERVGDLTRDLAADLAAYQKMIEERPEPQEPLAQAAIRDRLFRGPFLTVAGPASLSRGSTGQGLKG